MWRASLDTLWFGELRLVLVLLLQSLGLFMKTKETQGVGTAVRPVEPNGEVPRRLRSSVSSWKLSRTLLGTEEKPLRVRDETL